MGKFHDHGIGSKFHKAHSQKEGTPIAKEELLIHYTLHVYWLGLSI
jgi:hypothetical protein